MKTNALVKTIARSIHKTGFKLKKHSPEIFIIAGVAGTIVSTVMACKATTKASKVIEEAKEAIADIHEVKENNDEETYSERDYRNDLKITYVQTGIKLFKLYAPSVILGMLSITSILTSNNILRQRNAVLATSFAAVDKCFKDYRGNVIERFGAEVDRQLKYNIRTEEVEETIVDDKGKEKKVKKTVEVMPDSSSDMHSPYAKFFDEASRNWEKDSEYNLMFLRRQEQYANDLLKSRYNGKDPAILVLNEVYDMLDIPRTKLGQVTGWIYDPKNPRGDNYVDFGIYELGKERNRAFVNGTERNILLDFNVDGYILDLI